MIKLPDGVTEIGMSNDKVIIYVQEPIKLSSFLEAIELVKDKNARVIEFRMSIMKGVKIISLLKE